MLPHVSPQTIPQTPVRSSDHQPAAGERPRTPAPLACPTPLARMRAHALAARFADDARTAVVIRFNGRFDSIVHPLMTLNPTTNEITIP